jgi:predicted NBD/HSP70 family sugar kinase
VANAFDVLQTLCDAPVASRAELIERTGLSPASISRAVAELRRAGLVVERAAPNAGVGRPPRVVRLRSDAAHVVGIDAGSSRLRVVLADLEGHVVARATMTVRATGRAQGLVRSVAELVGSLTERAGVTAVAAAAGVSGIVEAESGTVLLSPDLPGFNQKPVAAMLTEALGMPVAIDNDDLLAAVGEAAFGAASGCTEVAFLSVGYGLGAGLIVGGRPVRGARSSAGAIAYFGSAHLGERASGRAIARRYKERRKMRDGGRLSAERVFELAGQDDPDAQAVVAEAIDSLGDVVVDVAALLDPQVVVLGGGLVRGQPAIIAKLAKRLQGLPFPPRLVASELGEDAVARGAVRLALGLAQHRLAGSATTQTSRSRTLESV